MKSSARSFCFVFLHCGRIFFSQGKRLKKRKRKKKNSRILVSLLSEHYRKRTRDEAEAYLWLWLKFSSITYLAFNLSVDQRTKRISSLSAILSYNKRLGSVLSTDVCLTESNEMFLLPSTFFFFFFEKRGEVGVGGEGGGGEYLKSFGSFVTLAVK